MSESLNEAILTVQATVPTIEKDSTAQAGSFSYKYSSLAAIKKKIQPVLTDQQLTVMHKLEVGKDLPSAAYLTTMVTHVPTKEQVMSSIPINTTDNPQTFGKAMTYYKRYQLCGLLGLVSDDEDDDAVTVTATQTRDTSHLVNQASQIVHSNTGPVSGGGTDYVITFGKYKGQTISDAGYENVSSYVTWLEKKAAGDGKPLSKNAAALKSALASYTFEGEFNPTEEIPF